VHVIDAFANLPDEENAVSFGQGEVVGNHTLEKFSAGDAEEIRYRDDELRRKLMEIDSDVGFEGTKLPGFDYFSPNPTQSKAKSS
jgi:hypothetical protein